jgi:hypothetical protein
MQHEMTELVMTESQRMLLRYSLIEGSTEDLELRKKKRKDLKKLVFSSKRKKDK